MPELLKCSEYDEIFVIENGKKHWIESWDTFTYLAEQNGFTWKQFLSQVKTIPFEELRDKYPIGPTKVVKTVTTKEIKEGKKPRDIFYPEEPENPYGWVRGLLTLNPKPSKEQAFDLGFNLILPFAGLVGGWDGKIIPNTQTVWSDESKVAAYSMCDEPDCRGWEAQRVLNVYKGMKLNAEKPVGTVICCDPGCGQGDTLEEKAKRRKEFVEVLNQLDLIMPSTYPYRDGHKWPGCDTPLEYMEWFESFFRENITVPVLPIIQAHWRTPAAPYLFEPDIMEQVKFWVDRGYGYIVYPWKDDGGSGVNMRREEWREANEWAKNNT